MSRTAAALRSDAVGSASFRGGLFALVYFAGAELGYALSLGPTVGGTFWPPSGIALAVLLVTPWRKVPALLIAGVAANFVSDVLHGQTLPASIGFVVANLGEPLLGAALLRALFPAGTTFVRLPEIAAVALVAAFVSTPLAAAVGAQTAQWYTQDPPGFFAGWTTWWVGDAVGALVLAPALLHVLAHWRRLGTVQSRVWAEAAALAGVLAVITQVVFTAAPGSTVMPFLVFPVLLWASLRLGPIGVGAGLCLVVVLTAQDTARGLGPFAAADLSLGERLVALQTYVGVMAVMFHGTALLWQERTAALTALRQAHSGLAARYRRIVEQSPFAVVTIEPSGVIKEANSAWRELMRTAGNRRSLADDPRFAPVLERAFKGEVVELPEHELEGAASTVRGFAYPIKDETGGVADVVLIVRDVTAEREAQRQLLETNRRLRDREEALSHALEQMAEAQQHREQLLAAERFARTEAERASQLKDQFLATLSHELRTPLNAIVGWAHILLASVTDASLSHAARTIERNARAQAKLIDELLDMSRITAGKVSLTLTRTKPAEIVAAVADALAPAAHTKDVRLSVDVADAAELVVMGDAARLQQVVANLLDNGIKFTPAGGSVTATLRGRGDRIELVVADTGQGIPEEFLGDVFERFRQADGSITRRHGGLGLGLSIAKQIVELHGGAIRAESEGRGRGATFTVTLPLTDVATVSADDEAPPANVGVDRLRVLVVDDEEDARELFVRLIAEHGCSVTSADSADAALQLLAAAPYDVLLTDIGMPETDGYELLRRVRAAELPVGTAVAVTAFARKEDRERALDAGFDGHLPKPISPVALLRVLANAASTARRSA
jgi:signal transduction histidine kinase/ActR/RegA family two-component response regulator